jgi:hypothetical protein
MGQDVGFGNFFLSRVGIFGVGEASYLSVCLLCVSVCLVCLSLSLCMTEAELDQLVNHPRSAMNHLLSPLWEQSESVCDAQ